MESIVYVVDDDGMVRIVLLRLLVLVGLKVCGFVLVDVFLCELLLGMLCCLLLDMKMFGLDGFEVVW